MEKHPMKLAAKDYDLGQSMSRWIVKLAQSITQLRQDNFLPEKSI
ncbi:MAG: hypothetical protein WBO17_12195 [Sphingorhabdus sp.]